MTLSAPTKENDFAPSGPAQQRAVGEDRLDMAIAAMRAPAMASWARVRAWEEAAALAGEVGADWVAYPCAAKRDATGGRKKAQGRARAHSPREPGGRRMASRADTANYLGISPRTLDRSVAAGDIGRPVAINARKLFDLDEVDAWIDRKKQGVQKVATDVPPRRVGRLSLSGPAKLLREELLRVVPGRSASGS